MGQCLHRRLRARFRDLADADVTNGGGDEEPLGAFQRAEHDFDGELRAVLAEAGKFDAGADLLRESFLICPKIVGEDAFGEALGNDVPNLLPDEFIA